MTIDTRTLATLLALVLGGSFVALAGAGGPPPFDRFGGLLPPSASAPAIYLGFGLAVLAAGGLTLVAAVALVTSLLTLAVNGAGALPSRTEVDPLIGGTMALVLIASVVLGGVTVGIQGPTGAGADLPFVSVALGGSASSVHGIVASDEFAGAGTAGGLPDYPDADGDRLPDDWERAGETPAGTPLPGADPRHKDLYVQVNYATGITPLTATEARQLRRIWAGMPVANPDGSTGIRLHVDDAAPQGGRVDAEITVHDAFDRPFLETYYDEGYLGRADCARYLVLFGRVTSRYDGYGMIPGYLSVVDGTEREPTGNYSTRVTILTHELLHNTVGRMASGRTHVRRGWLHGFEGRFEPSMSTAVRRELTDRGFARSSFFEQELCDRPVGVGRSHRNRTVGARTTVQAARGVDGAFTAYPSSS